VFAYGQTGSGKTFTMEGGDEDNEEQVISYFLKN
jgi:Kinesin motor domain